MSNATLRVYLDELQKVLRTIEYEYDFRKKYGDHGILLPWQFTAEAMAKHTNKARVLLVKMHEILDLAEIGRQEESDE